MRIPLPILFLPILAACGNRDADLVVPPGPECGERFFEVFKDEDPELGSPARFEGATEDAHTPGEPLGTIRVSEREHGENPLRLSGRMRIIIPEHAPPRAHLDGSLNGIDMSYEDGNYLRFERGHMWCDDGRFVGQARQLGYDLLFLAKARRAEDGETWDWSGFHPDPGDAGTPDAGAPSAPGPLPEAPARQVADLWILECTYDDSWTFRQHIDACPPVAEGTMNRTD